MQQRKRRSNQDRTDATRAALIDAARSLFVDQGYADTGTPEIVTAAQVTRGALYHHFKDKADLFRAVVMAEARAVADDIDDRTKHLTDPIDGLTRGTEAYFTAMMLPGRARLLLIEAPAVLGLAEMARIDAEAGGASLKDGLAAAGIGAGDRVEDLGVLADVLSAAFDRAALAIAAGGPEADYRKAIAALLTGLLNGRMTT